MTDSVEAVPAREALETMVAEADTGGRKPTGFSKTYIFTLSLAWALFQLWYASPLPYKFHFGVINDGQARIAHLTFAFLLAFATFPARKSSPRNRIPVTDWILAAEIFLRICARNDDDSRVSEPVSRSEVAATHDWYLDRLKEQIPIPLGLYCWTPSCGLLTQTRKLFVSFLIRKPRDETKALTISSCDGSSRCFPSKTALRAQDSPMKLHLVRGIIN